jgi:hypothetical protein
MKPVWGHVLMGLSLAAGGAWAFSACVHNDSTIFIRDVLAPQTASSSTMVCSYTADPTQPTISSGVVDIALRATYDAEFLIGNQMVAQVNGSQLQTETSIVTIQGAIVRVTSGTQQLSTYTRLASASIPPLSGNTAGYGAVGPVTIIDEPSLSSAGAFLTSQGAGAVTRLVSHVRFFGVTLGGQSVESNEFEFPVDVCIGCLIAFTNNPLYATPNCVGTAAGSGSTQAVVPCQPGQDLAVDCNACQANPACRGAVQGAVAVDAGAG